VTNQILPDTSPLFQRGEGMALEAKRNKRRRKMKQLETEIKALRLQLDRMSNPYSIAEHPELHKRMDELVTEHVRLQQELLDEGQ